MDTHGIMIDGMAVESPKFDPESDVKAIEAVIGVLNETADLLARADFYYTVAWRALNAARLVDECAGENGSGTSGDNNFGLKCALFRKAQELRLRLINWIDWIDGGGMGYSALIALIRPAGTLEPKCQVDDVFRQRAELEHINQIVLSKLAADELPEKPIVAEVIAATIKMAALLDKEMKELRDFRG